MKVNNKLNEDFTEIISSNSVLKFFWEQQKCLFTSSSSGTRYHPIIICFCKSAAAKSPSVNEKLCNTNNLQLPSARSLKDYKKFIHRKQGFQKKVVDDLIKRTT